MVGWLDLLKGILPDSLIKVDNRKLIITGSEVVFGDKSINDPEIIKKVWNKISEYQNQDSLPFDIIHKDIEKDFFEYEELSISQKESLRLLKSVLTDEDVECVMMARRVHISWSKKDSNLTESLIQQLEKNHPRNGKKVLNLINAGYFDLLIIPMIETYKVEYGESKYMEEFRKFYKDLLTFFPTAIFVGNNTSKEVIIKELKRRLSLRGLPFIRIHAMGEVNIEKVESAIWTMKEDLRNFFIKDNRSISSNGIKAQMLEIRMKTQS